MGLKLCPHLCFIIRRSISLHHTMLPPMKSMKAGAAKAMTKGALLKAIATEHGLKTKACSNVLNSLVTVAAKEVKDRCIRGPRPLSHQTQDQASHKGMH